MAWGKVCPGVLSCNWCQDVSVSVGRFYSWEKFNDHEIIERVDPSQYNLCPELYLLLVWYYGEEIISLGPGRNGNDFKRTIFKLTSWIWYFSNSYGIDQRRAPLDPTVDKSTLVQVMACYCQATSHYLNQCRRRFMSPYGVTRPQWVNDRTKKRSSGSFMCQTHTWLNLTE